MSRAPRVPVEVLEIDQKREILLKTEEHASENKGVKQMRACWLGRRVARAAAASATAGRHRRLACVDS
jgi:hypothetical protein